MIQLLRFDYAAQIRTIRRWTKQNSSEPPQFAGARGPSWARQINAFHARFGEGPMGDRHSKMQFFGGFKHWCRGSKRRRS